MTVQQRFPRLSIVWSYIRPHRTGLLIALILGLLGTGIGLATPWAAKWVIDSLGARAGLSGPVLVLLVLVLVGAVINFGQWLLLGTIAERVVLDARRGLIRRLLAARVPDLSRRPTGELVTRVTSDTVLLREAASSAAIGLINGVIGVIGCLVLMAVLDPVLLGVTLAAVVVVLLLFVRLMPTIARAETQAQEAIGELGADLEGSLRAIRTVKASRAERQQGDRIERQAVSSTQHSLRAVRATAWAWSISWGGIQLAILIILAVGALRVDAGLLPVSSLVAFLLYAFQLVGPLTELSQDLTAMQSGLAAAERIRQLDDLVPEQQEPSPATESAGRLDQGPLISLRGVRVGYGRDRPALDGVDLDLPRRGHVALVGPSGAGKTTLFALLLRFLEPDAGEIRLEGRPYAAYSIEQIRSRFGYVEQDTPLIPGGLADNLTLAAPEAGQDEIEAVLRAVQLDGLDLATQGPGEAISAETMSGGQRQRLAVARALLRLPDVLLLDEATAQLDGLTETAIHRCIRQAAAQGTVVTIAHRLSTVVDADTIVLLEAGRVRAQGTHQELLSTDALYADLVRALKIRHEPGADTGGAATGTARCC